MDCEVEIKKEVDDMSPMCHEKIIVDPNLPREYADQDFLANMNKFADIKICPYCPVKFESAFIQEFRAHLKNCHTKEIGPCRNCNTRVGGVDAQINHIVLCRNLDLPVPDQPMLWKDAQDKHRSKIICGIDSCQFEGYSTSTLDIHKILSHKDLQTLSKSYSPDLQVPKKKYSPDLPVANKNEEKIPARHEAVLHQCPLCSKKFWGPVMLQNHLQREHMHRPDRSIVGNTRHKEKEKQMEDSQTDICKCSLCGFTGSSSKLCFQHAAALHSAALVSGDYYVLYGCFRCGLWFDSIRWRNYHLVSAHQPTSDTKADIGDKNKTSNILSKSTTSSNTVLPRDLSSSPSNTRDRTSTPINTRDRTYTPSNTRDPTSSPSNTRDPTSSPSNTRDPTSSPIDTRDRSSTASNTQDRTYTPSDTRDRYSTPSNTCDRSNTSRPSDNIAAVNSRVLALVPRSPGQQGVKRPWDWEDPSPSFKKNILGGSRVDKNRAPGTLKDGKKSKIVKCVICYETIIGPVQDHIDKHKVKFDGEEVFQCPCCPTLGRKLKTLLTHIQTEHGSLSSRIKEKQTKNVAPKLKSIAALPINKDELKEKNREETDPLAEDEIDPVPEEETDPLAAKETGTLAEKETDPLAEEYNDPLGEKDTDPTAEKETDPLAEDDSVPSGPLSGKEKDFQETESLEEMNHNDVDPLEEKENLETGNRQHMDDVLKGKRTEEREEERDIKDFRYLEPLVKLENIEHAEHEPCVKQEPFEDYELSVPEPYADPCDTAEPRPKLVADHSARKIVRNKAAVESDDEGSDTSAELSDQESDCEVVEKMRKDGRRVVSRQYRCGVCSLSFSPASNYYRHLHALYSSYSGTAPADSQTFNKKLQVSCTKCVGPAFSANNLLVLDKHIQTVHSGLLVRQCPLCPEFKTSLPHLLGHHIKYKKHQINNTLITCALCRIPLTAMRNFRGHLFSKHDINASSRDTAFFYVGNLSQILFIP